MITVHDDRHRLHDPQGELSGGAFVAPHESPSRVERVLERVREVRLGDVTPPKAFGLEPVTRVHDPGFVAFLETAYEEWTRAGNKGDALPNVWPARDQIHRPSKAIDGKLGFYALAADTAITSGTWEAARAAADVALTAADLVASGASSAFGLCRPPGHHAARDLYGGYCFLNNAAIAAEAWLARGATRVAILDVDFHHGNGTQSIFYGRSDVFFQSLHGDPLEAFPFFSGHADEKGAGGGEGWTANYPLPRGTAWDRWSEALEAACKRIEDVAPDGIVVSLGVDTYKNDPISFFSLDTPDYSRLGARLRRLRVPSVFVMEGGYAIEAIGENVVGALAGFEGG